MDINSDNMILHNDLWGIRCMIDAVKTKIEAVRSEAETGGAEAVRENVEALARVLDYAADQLRAAVAGGDYVKKALEIPPPLGAPPTIYYNSTVLATGESDSRGKVLIDRNTAVMAVVLNGVKAEALK